MTSPKSEKTKIPSPKPPSPSTSESSNSENVENKKKKKYIDYEKTKIPLEKHKVNYEMTKIPLENVAKKKNVNCEMTKIPSEEQSCITMLDVEDVAKKKNVKCELKKVPSEEQLLSRMVDAENVVKKKNVKCEMKKVSSESRMGKAASVPRKKRSVFSMSLEEKILENILKAYEVGEAATTTTTLKTCMSVGMNMDSYSGGDVASESGSPVENAGTMMEEAWKKLYESVVTFNGRKVGTLAANDTTKEILNYNQVFVRDFIPCGLACLMKEPPETDMVRNFLLSTLHLQGWEKNIDNFTMAKGVMPASFKIQKPAKDKENEKDVLEADFGGTAIGRVSPVDSGFWWIILLHAYIKCTQQTLTEFPELQNGMMLILDLCLSDGFDTFPTLLCTDGCCMIDRRMGVYGYPIEIQSLFYFALRCAKSMLKEGMVDPELSERIYKRIDALTYHVRNYYWLDFTQLNNIYCYKTEEYSKTAVNKFNVMPDTINGDLFDFMPLNGGFFVGNVSPARMDFRWFLVGNCITIMSSLATPDQERRIMDLIEARWDYLIGEMPLKIVYPALEGEEWRIVTGCDPKNTSWSYHNGGSWPVLIWLLTAACIKAGRPQIAKRAIELLEPRLARDGWPEYYDGKDGRYIGKQARKYQTWSIAGYLVAKLMIENPANLRMISLLEDKDIKEPRLIRTTSAPTLKADRRD